MHFERLSLEVIATKSHWAVADPPTLVGRSGVTHRFDFLAIDGRERLAFDIYEQLAETDVIRTFVKKLDTRATAFIICPGDKVEEGADKLAKEYGLKVLRSESIGSDFRTRKVEPSSHESEGDGHSYSEWTRNRLRLHRAASRIGEIDFRRQSGNQSAGR